MRGRAGEPDLLPDPDDDFDLGDLEPDPMPAAGGSRNGTRNEAVWPVQDDVPDEPPANIPPPSARPRGGKAPKVTVTMRRDIEAKVGLMLEMPGRVWAARDPWCGGQFVESVPQIRPALTDLILQSPDLIEWFTGVGGGFMLWLNLMAALQPVAVTVWAHHIAHAIGGESEGAAPDPRAYAA